jgi:alpha-1,2-mannosyltransferase
LFASSSYFNSNIGYHATTATEFAKGFEAALSLSASETLAMRRRARVSAQRFTEKEFAKGWLHALEQLVEMRRLQ